MFGCFKPLLCVVCRHSIYLMSLFHGHFASRNQENRIGRRDSSPDFFLREGRRLYTGLFFRRRWEKTSISYQLHGAQFVIVKLLTSTDSQPTKFHVQSERILDQRENGVKIGILSVKTIFHLQCKNTYHLRKV